MPSRASHILYLLLLTSLSHPKPAASFDDCNPTNTHQTITTPLAGGWQLGYTACPGQLTRLVTGYSLYTDVPTLCELSLSHQHGGLSFACSHYRDRFRDILDDCAWIFLLLLLAGDVELNPGPDHFDLGVPRYAAEEVAEVITMHHRENAEQRRLGALNLTFNVSDKTVQYFASNHGIVLQPDCSKRIRGHESAAVLRQLAENYIANRLEHHDYLEIAPNFREVRKGNHYCTLLAIDARDRSRATVALNENLAPEVKNQLQLAMQQQSSGMFCCNGFQNCYHSKLLAKAGMVHDLDPKQLPQLMRQHGIDIMYVSMFLPLDHDRNNPYHDDELGITQTFTGEHVRFHFIGHDVHAYQHSIHTYYDWYKPAHGDAVDHVTIEAVYRVGPVAVLRCVRVQGLLNLSRPSDSGRKVVKLRLWVTQFERLLHASRGFLFTLRPGTMYRKWLDHFMTTVDYVELEEEHVRRMMEFILSREDQTYRRQSSHSYFKAIGQRIRIGMNELQKGFTLPLDKLQAIYTQLFIVGSVWRQLDTRQTGIILDGVTNRLPDSFNLPEQVFALLSGYRYRPFHWVKTNIAELIVFLSSVAVEPTPMHEYSACTPVPRSHTPLEVGETFHGHVTPPNNCVPKSISILIYGSESYTDHVKQQLESDSLDGRTSDNVASVQTTFPGLLVDLVFDNGHCVPVLSSKRYCRHSVGRVRDALPSASITFKEYAKCIPFASHVVVNEELVVSRLHRKGLIAKLRDPDYKLTATIRGRRFRLRNSTRITAIRYGIGVRFANHSDVFRNPTNGSFDISPALRETPDAAANRNILKFELVAPLLEHMTARLGVADEFVSVITGTDNIAYARELAIHQPAIAFLCAAPGNDLAYACERSNITTVCVSGMHDYDRVAAVARHRSLNVFKDFNITCASCMQQIEETFVFADLGSDAEPRALVATLAAAIVTLINAGKQFVLKWQNAVQCLSKPCSGTAHIIDLCAAHHLTIFTLPLASGEAWITSRVTEMMHPDPTQAVLPLDDYKYCIGEEQRIWYKWPMERLEPDYECALEALETIEEDEQLDVVVPPAPSAPTLIGATEATTDTSCADFATQTEVLAPQATAPMLPTTATIATQTDFSTTVDACVQSELINCRVDSTAPVSTCDTGVQCGVLVRCTSSEIIKQAQLLVQSAFEPTPVAPPRRKRKPAASALPKPPMQWAISKSLPILPERLASERPSVRPAISTPCIASFSSPTPNSGAIPKRVPRIERPVVDVSVTGRQSPPAIQHELAAKAATATIPVAPPPPVARKAIPTARVNSRPSVNRTLIEQPALVKTIIAPVERLIRTSMPQTNRTLHQRFTPVSTKTGTNYQGRLSKLIPDAVRIPEEEYAKFFSRFLRTSLDDKELSNKGFGVSCLTGSELHFQPGTYNMLISAEGLIAPKLPTSDKRGFDITSPERFYQLCAQARRENLTLNAQNDAVAVAIIATTAAIHAHSVQLHYAQPGKCFACEQEEKVTGTAQPPVLTESAYIVDTDDITAMHTAAQSDLARMKLPGTGDELAKKVVQRFKSEALVAFNHPIKYIHGAAGCAKTSALVATIDLSKWCVVSPFKVNLPEFTKGLTKPRKAWTFHSAYANYDGTIPLIIDEIAAFHPYIATALIYRASEHGSEVIVIGDPKQGKQVDKLGKYRGITPLKFYQHDLYHEVSYSMLPDVAVWLANLGLPFRTASKKYGRLHVHKPAMLTGKTGQFYCVTTQMAATKTTRDSTWSTCTSAQGMRTKDMHIMLEESGIPLLRADNYALLYMILSRATENVHVYMTQNMERALKYRSCFPHSCTKATFQGNKHIGQEANEQPLIFTHVETTDAAHDAAPQHALEDFSRAQLKTRKGNVRRSVAMSNLFNIQKRERRNTNHSRTKPIGRTAVGASWL
nr:Polyprotein CDS [Astacus astacus]